MSHAGRKGKDARERQALKDARARDEQAANPPTEPPEPCPYCGSLKPPTVCCEVSRSSA